MAVREQDVELIVRQILGQLEGVRPSPSAVHVQGGEIPSTAHVAMLTELGKFEIKEYPMPKVGDDDILVKVEGCGVCGSKLSKKGSGQCSGGIFIRIFEERRRAALLNCGCSPQCSCFLQKSRLLGPCTAAA